MKRLQQKSSRIKIESAKYISGYKLEITFSDNTVKIVDFELFLAHNTHPQWSKYEKIDNFKKFKIENGNVVWVKDWDLIFPINQLHNGIVN
jgi:hypothetical protein